MLFDKDSNNRNNPLLQTLCCDVHKTHLHWTNRNRSFSEFLLCKSSPFCSPVSFVESLTWPFFENSMFVLTGLASLQICIKTISYVESSSHSLTRWVKVELASINSNNQIANICGLAFVSFVNNSFTCRRYRPSFNQTLPNFQQRIIIAFCQWRQFGTWRAVQTNIGQDRKNTFKFEHVSAFVVLKLNHSLHSLQCWDKVFVFVPAQKDFEWRHFFLLPHKLFPKWNSLVFQSVAFQKLSIWPAQIFSSNHYRSTFPSLDFRFKECCNFVVCCQRLRTEDVFCCSVYLGCWIDRVGKIFSSLMSCKLSGLNQGR